MNKGRRHIDFFLLIRARLETFTMHIFCSLIIGVLLHMASKIQSLFRKTIDLTNVTSVLAELSLMKALVSECIDEVTRHD